LRWWFSRGCAAPALSLLLLIALTHKSPLRGAPSDDIAVRCTNASGKDFDILFKLGLRKVVFDNGPKLEILDVTEQPDGLVRVRARSHVYEMSALIGTTASIKFRHIPEKFDEITCNEVRRTRRRSSSG
jgi:hypothetical protein